MGPGEGAGPHRLKKLGLVALVLLRLHHPGDWRLMCRGIGVDRE
ncbi:MAG: hypothetical protein ACYDIC_07660 [Desulfobaccales bacterium]